MQGQVYDAETGLHQNGFRDYNPALGRYAQSDPIGLGGGLNSYGYVEANPVIYVDPDGLLLSALHGLSHDMSTEDAVVAGAMGNSAATAGAVAAGTGATVAAAAAATVAIGVAAICTSTGRALTVAGLQALSAAQRAGGIAIPQGLGGTAPTSQSAIITVIRQALDLANRAARNLPAISRPTLPK